MDNVTSGTLSASPVSMETFSTSEIYTISANVSRVVHHLGANTTPIEEDSLESIVYGSMEEKVLTMFAIALLAVTGLCGQGAVIFTIAKAEVLKTAEYGLVLSHALVECIFLIICLYGQVHSAIAGGDFWPVCEFLSPLASALYIGLPYHHVVMAYERCVFFCWPMYYNRKVTVTKITCLVVSIYVTTLSYMFILKVVLGMTYQASYLICMVSHSLVKKYIQVSLVFALPLILLIVIAVLIGKTTWSAHVAPAVPQGVTIPPPPPILMARKVVRIILLVSGTFIMVRLPAMLAKKIITGGGYTREDLNARVALWPVIVIRVCTLVQTVLSPILHAAINFYCRKQLRRELKKITGIGTNTVHPE